MARRDFSATSGSERPGRLALVGLILAPLLVGGILAWALATPTAGLDRITAAIVNEDEPVTLNGQTVPLGRQFAAGLMAAQEPAQPTPTASTAPSSVPATPSFTWVLTNPDDAAAGLASGEYAAVVTIPKGFSADATSYSGPAAQARQAAITVTTTPASAWLDPALTSVVAEHATAELNRQLIEQYLNGVYTGFNTLSTQIGEAADGAVQLASGAKDTATGAAQVSTGAADLSEGLDSLASGAADLAAGLSRLASSSARLPADTAALARAAVDVSAGTERVARAVDRATARLAVVVDLLCQTPGPLCDRADNALDELKRADEQVTALSVGARIVKAGNADLAQAMPGLVQGIDGADSGAGEVSKGAGASSTGAQALAGGAAEVAGGTAQVDAGAAQLSSGLAEATEQIPTYTEDDIKTLSTVVSQPVTAEQDAIAPGLQSAPLFTAVALWIGGFAIALAFQAVPARRLFTSAATGRIAGRAVLPGVVIGALQGLVVAAVVLGSVAVTPVEWLAFTAAALGVGAVFALANLGLAAAFGGAGRLVAVALGLLALAAGLSGTVPPVIEGLSGPLPTTHGLDALRGTLTGDAAGVWSSLGVLAIIAAIAFVLVYAGVAARRAPSVRR
jgi:putative membrane protein